MKPKIPVKATRLDHPYNDRLRRDASTATQPVSTNERRTSIAEFIQPLLYCRTATVLPHDTEVSGNEFGQIASV
jgi:hypothetical protein